MLGVAGADFCRAVVRVFLGVENVEAARVGAALCADNMASVGQPVGFDEVAVERDAVGVLGRDDAGLARVHVVNGDAKRPALLRRERDEVRFRAAPVRLGGVVDAGFQARWRAAGGVDDVKLRAGFHRENDAAAVGRIAGRGFRVLRGGEARGLALSAGGDGVEVRRAAVAGENHHDARAVGAVARAHVGAVEIDEDRPAARGEVELKDVGKAAVEETRVEKFRAVGRPAGREDGGVLVGHAAKSGLIEKEVANMDFGGAGCDFADEREARGEIAVAAACGAHGGVGGAIERVAKIPAAGGLAGDGLAAGPGDIDAHLRGRNRRERERVSGIARDAHVAPVRLKRLVRELRELRVARDGDADRVERGQFGDVLNILAGLRARDERDGGGGKDKKRCGEELFHEIGSPFLSTDKAGVTTSKARRGSKNYSQTGASGTFFRAVTSDSIKEILKQVKYPGFSRDIVSFGLVRDAGFAGGVAKVTLALTTSDPKIPPQIKAEVDKCLCAQPGVRDTIIEIAITPAKPPAPAATSAGASAAPATPAAATQPGVGASATAAPAGIKRSVAIASGKGGVGKTTFAVNLACALAQLLAAQGRAGRVGLLDCDIYGPSVPLMMGINGRPFAEGEGANAMIIPLENHGVKMMSMGFLVEAGTPVIWRGPMVMRAIQQFVQNVKWGELDILLIDLPPGTGDAQLSLVQTLPLDGAVLVTTPQLAATQVALKGGLMFQKVNVPILGVAENMSWFTDPAGNRHALFGAGGGAQTAAALNAPLLGQVPLQPEIREGGDAGAPIVVTSPQSEAAASFRQIGEALLARLPKK